MSIDPIALRASAPSQNALVVGVELGGTKCICTLADDRGTIVDQQRFPTTTPEATLAALSRMIDDWCETKDIAALGIASFGPLDLDLASPTYGRIAQTTKPGWANADLLGVLGRRWNLPTAFDTDVNGAAAAEMRWGSGRSLDDFAYVTVGTGVGVGLYVNGRATRGIGHCEMGHILVPRRPVDQVPGSCSFHADCVEGIASGPAVEAALGGRRLLEVASDDPVWDRVAFAIAGLCHALVCTAGPRRIAIGGGVVIGQPHLLDKIEPLLRKSVNGYVSIPDDQPYIVAPELDEQAGPLGPIALAFDLIAPKRALRSA